MANQPTAPTDQPPPELPNMPDVSDTLSRYLRTFSVWCRNGFRDKLSANSAAPGVMLQAYDATAGAIPPIYELGINTAGIATIAPVRPGSGQPSKPTIGTGVPINPGNYLPLSGGVITGPITPSGGVVGVTNGSNASLGQVGEVISALRLSTAALTLTTGIGVNIATINLTPGDWDVQGNAWFAVGVSATNLQAGITNVSATIPAETSIGLTRVTENIALAGGGQMRSISPCRVNVTVNTTYYLYASLSFPSGTCTVYGSIWARRAR
ncbi:MAG TPA: hypothetical protein VJ255_02760 [Candidatus Acidoferrum sp.]|jgi:hypothetical protein|nr:hypothetical protein [Candidatus Acidoferrum sp.]